MRYCAHLPILNLAKNFKRKFFSKGYMMRIKLPNSYFEEHENSIRLIWRETLYADFEKKLLGRAIKRKFRIKPTINAEDGYLIVDAENEEIERLITFLIQSHLGEFLRSRYTKRRVLYIHEGMDVPLLGYNAFGLIDRGTNLIQVRGSTGCNVSCIFCSVDEGPYSKTRILDYVVDVDYLLKWFDEIAQFKGKGLEAHLDGQGEPLLYPFIVELVQGLRENPMLTLFQCRAMGFCSMRS